MSQATVLKVAFCLCAFLWAFVAIDNEWGPVVVLGLCLAAVSLGASAAKDLGRDGSREWIREHDETDH